MKCMKAHFFSYYFIEMSLMMPSIQSHNTNSFLDFNNHKCLLKILNEIIDTVKVVALLTINHIYCFWSFLTGEQLLTDLLSCQQGRICESAYENIT